MMSVHLRGTLIPLYGANNLLGQLPVVGLFLGGEKEGLVGVTYEVVGKPGNPVLHVNPLSALAPGLLRKVFEFPATSPATRANAAQCRRRHRRGQRQHRHQSLDAIAHTGLSKT